MRTRRYFWIVTVLMLVPPAFATAGLPYRYVMSASWQPPKSEPKPTVASRELASRYGGKTVMEWVKVLDDTDGNQRVLAADILGAWGPEALPAAARLEAILKEEPDPARKFRVATALGGIGPGAIGALPTMMEQLDTQDGALGEALTRALIRMGPGVVTALVQELEGPRRRRARARCLEAIAELGTAAQAADKAILACLKDRDEAIRLRATRAWGFLGDRESIRDSVGIVALMLEDTSPLVRIQAARSLGRIGSPSASATRALLRALEIPDPELREALTPAIPRVIPDPVTILTREMGNSTASVRGGAVLTLGTIGTLASNASAVIIARLEDPAPEVRALACLALGRFVAARIAANSQSQSNPSPADPAIPPMVAALIRALDDKDPAVPVAAVKALGRTGPYAQPALPRFVAILTPSDANTKIKLPENIIPETLRTLSRLGPDARSALPGLTALLAPKAGVKASVTQDLLLTLARIDPSGTAITPAIIPLLTHDDGYVRSAALIALGRTAAEPTRILPALFRAVDDPVDEVRLAALQAITQRAGQIPAVPPGLLETLDKALDDINRDLREEAAAALIAWSATIRVQADINIIPIKTTLTRRLDDPDIFVRGESALALWQLDPTPDAQSAIQKHFTQNDSLANYLRNAYVRAILPTTPDSADASDSASSRDCNLVLPGLTRDLEFAVTNQDLRICRKSLKTLARLRLPLSAAGASAVRLQLDRLLFAEFPDPELRRQALSLRDRIGKTQEPADNPKP